MGKGITMKMNLNKISQDILSNRKAPKYEIIMDGQDAVIKFGKHAGRKVSQIWADNPEYLYWLYSNTYIMRLKEVIQIYLDKQAEDGFINEAPTPDDVFNDTESDPLKDIFE